MTNSANCDCEWLIKMVRGVMLRFDGQRKIHRSISDAHGAYHAYRPATDVSLAVYLEEFTALVETIEHYGGCIGHDTALIEHETAAAMLEAKKKAARDKLLAMDFLKKAPRGRFGGLLMDLDNLFSRGANQYPKDLVEAHALLVNYQPPCNPTNKPLPEKTDEDKEGKGGGSDMSFAQLATPVPGTDGSLYSHIQCFACKRKGHYADMCPRDDVVQLFQTDDPDAKQANEDANFTFTSVGVRETPIPQTWVLLDSQSTVSVFCNASLLTRIRPCKVPLVVLTNGGRQTSNYVGEVRNFGTVWYNPDSLANILSLAEVRCKYRVTMDSALEPSMCVHRSNGTVMKFVEYASGLYYHDTAPSIKPSSESVSGYSFIVTVAGNKDRFHRREIEDANWARALYAMIGRPSQQQFEFILNNNLIRNCPVTVDDARRAVTIYGPDVPALKGKAVKSEPVRVPTSAPGTVPVPILGDHGNVTLCADFFFVQGMPFFT